MSHPPSIKSTKFVPEGSTTLGDSQPSETPHNDTIQNEKSKSNDSDQKLSNPRTVALLVSVFLSMLLVAVDRTIISTVIMDHTLTSYLADHCPLGHSQHY